MATCAWLQYWRNIRRGSDCGRLKREHMYVPTEGGSSTHIQLKLTPSCQIFPFWKEAENPNFCGKFLEFEILVINMNIFECSWPMTYLLGVSLGR